MQIQQLPANAFWDAAISLDKHVVSSIPTGYNDAGYMQFETIRTPLGEAVFQLKYRSDFTQVEFLARSAVQAINDCFGLLDVVIPMPASRIRERQPVHEVASLVARLLGARYCSQTLIKTHSTGVMKDLDSREERVAALNGCFEWQPGLQPDEGRILVLDDLFDTGASLEAACSTLRAHPEVASISVVALTRRN